MRSCRKLIRSGLDAQFAWFDASRSDLLKLLLHILVSPINSQAGRLAEIVVLPAN